MTHTVSVAAPAAPEYISLELAGKFLDLSPRRVLELAKNEKKLRYKKGVSDETHQVQTFVLSSDVRHLAIERRAVAGPPAELSLPAAAAIPTPADPWWTIDEAAAYTRLPASGLLAMIEDGRLAALEFGVRPGGRYRVQRSALDAIKGVLRSAKQRE